MPVFSRQSVFSDNSVMNITQARLIYGTHSIITSSLVIHGYDCA